MTAFIGFIMLMGLVTKNSILLVDFANRARAEGATADVAMRHAGPVRLRPILMTALSLILAMVPVALGFGSGGEFRSSMAIAIMGGMITSTMLTLLIVPVAYSIVVGALDRLGCAPCCPAQARMKSDRCASYRIKSFSKSTSRIGKERRLQVEYSSPPAIECSRHQKADASGPVDRPPMREARQFPSRPRVPAASRFTG